MLRDLRVSLPRMNPRSLVAPLLFPAPRPSYSHHSFPNELLWIPHCLDYGSCTAGDCIPAIFLRCPAARYFVLYFHSNGDDIGLCYSFGRGLRMVLEVHVLLIEFPGYGICPGDCSEETFWAAAVAAFRFVVEVLQWPAEDIIIMGRSLGTAVATRLARTYHCHGVILISPFVSLVEAYSRYIGALAPMFIGEMFSNEHHMTKLRVPTLVIHGLKDSLVPCSQGLRLYALSAAKKKMMVTPEEMTHNSDLLSNAEFLIRPMLRFFALPDYAFVDMLVPPEAFDKRFCPKYHRLFENAKGDAPMQQPMGDREPGPTSTTTLGPQNHVDAFPGAAGDVDNLEALDGLHTVRSPRRSEAAPSIRPTQHAAFASGGVTGIVGGLSSWRAAPWDESASTTVDSDNSGNTGGPSESASGDGTIAPESSWAGLGCVGATVQPSCGAMCTCAELIRVDSGNCGPGSTASLISGCTLDSTSCGIAVGRPDSGCT